MTLLVIGAVFLATFALAAVAVIGGRKMMEQSAEPLERQAGTDPLAEEGAVIDWDAPVNAPTLLREDSLSTISFWDRILAKVDGVHILRIQLAEAGLRWSVGRLTSLMLLSAAATFAILWKMSWLPGLAAAGIATLAGFAPYTVVHRRRKQRLFLLEDQFPDALDTLARALRAGNPLSAGMELLTREVPQPLAGEFRKTLDERNLGVNWERALEHLAERIPVTEVSVFVAAVQIQSRTGGKLHEVLTKLAENMRESAALKGEIRAIASHGQLTGTILTLLPVGIAAMMAIVNPAHILVLWTNEVGRMMVAAAIACLVLAHFVIRKLMEIEV